MSIADTLLLINDDPSKPLNQHFNDSLIALTNWISNAIQFVASDNMLEKLTNDIGAGEKITISTMKHKGVLRTRFMVNSTSGTAKFYKNGALITTLGGMEGKTMDISVEKGDVFSVENTGSNFSIRVTTTFSGMPILVDF